MPNLNAEDLIAAVARDCGQTQATVKATLDSLALITTQSVLDGETVIIPGVGRVSAKIRGPRNQRNPKTGEMMLLPPKQVPHFTAAKPLATAIASLSPL